VPGKSLNTVMLVLGGILQACRIEGFGSDRPEILPEPQPRF
jgi:hypothetical protein